jgi:hypothetical protein
MIVVTLFIAGCQSQVGDGCDTHPDRFRRQCENTLTKNSFSFASFARRCCTSSLDRGGIGEGTQWRWRQIKPEHSPTGIVARIIKVGVHFVPIEKFGALTIIIKRSNRVI